MASTSKQQSERKDFVRQETKQLALKIRFQWLKQILSQYYESITDSEVEQILKKGEDEIERYTKISDELHEFLSGHIPDWSLPLFLLETTNFDIKYFYPLVDLRLDTSELAVQDRKTLDLDLEEFLDNFIRAAYVKEVGDNFEAFVASRVSSNSKVERCIFIAEKQSHGDKEDKSVLVFGMYVEEHNKNANKSERYRVYIQFIAKTGLQKRKFYPTIPQVVLIGYMRFVELLGYDYAHLWIDPPDPNEDYVFRDSSANIQHTPREMSFQVLKDWYTALFKEHKLKSSPYTWDIRLNLPPTFGSQGEPDIKRRGDMTKDIISMLQDVVIRISAANKELNELFSKVTMVTELNPPIILLKEEAIFCSARDVSAFSEWPPELEPMKLVKYPNISFNAKNPSKYIESSEFVLSILYKNQRSATFRKVEPTHLLKSKIPQANSIVSLNPVKENSQPILFTKHVGHIPNLVGHTAVVVPVSPTLGARSSVLLFGGSADFEFLVSDMYEIFIDNQLPQPVWTRVLNNNNASIEQNLDDDNTGEDQSSVPQGRYGHSCCVFEKSLYVFGGLNEEESSMNDLWEYKLETKQWEQLSIISSSKQDQETQMIPSPRAFHSAVTYNSCMYLFGGTSIIENSKSEGFSDLFEFNFTKRKWNEIIPQKVPGVSPAQYSPDNGEEAETPPDRYGHSACVFEDSMYVFGGAFGDHMVFYCDLYEYNFKNRVWQEIKAAGTIPEARKFHSVVTTESAMLIFGGERSDGFVNSLFEYNFKNNTWTKVETEGNVPHGITSCSACVVGGEMVIFGGWVRDVAQQSHETESQTGKQQENYKKTHDLYLVKLPTATRKAAPIAQQLSSIDGGQ